MDDLFVVDEFTDFFADIILGGIPAPQHCSASGGKVSNSVNADDLISTVSDTLRKYSTKTKQDVFTKQNVEITCGGDDVKINPNILTYGKHQKDLFGNDKEGTGCVVRGCCPEVNQIARIKLAAINKTSIKESTEMVNKITEQITAETSVKADACGRVQPSVDSKLYQGDSSQVYRQVRDIINKEANLKYDGSQTIKINYNRPLVCVNHCDEPPRSQTITQEINIDAMARNIIDIISEDVDKTTIDTVIKASVSVDSSDTMKHTKGYIYSIVSCILILIVYGLFYILSVTLLMYLLKMTPKDQPTVAKHAFTVFLIYIIYTFWEFFSCLFGGDNIFKCVGLFHWMKCTGMAIGSWFLSQLTVGSPDKCSEECCPEDYDESSLTSKCTTSR